MDIIHGVIATKGGYRVQLYAAIKRFIELLHTLGSGYSIRHRTKSCESIVDYALI
jgi:hypothetical protein